MNEITNLSKVNSYDGLSEEQRRDALNCNDEEFFNTDPLNVSNVEIENPHGLLGAMCRNMQKMAARRLDLSYPLYGLHILSLLSAGRHGYQGAKLSFFSIISAESASGKDLGQNYLALVANELSLSKYMFDKPRSDKDLIVNLIATDGLSCYKIDEVHGLFNSINSKQAQSYHAGIGDELLKMATTRLYTLSGLHRREQQSIYLKLLAKAERKLEKATDDKARDYANKEINLITKTLDKIESGFPSPIVNFAGASTPQNIDNLINEDNIHSGLLGRSIIIRCDEGREELQTDRDDFIQTDILKRLINIKNGSFKPINASNEAKKYLELLSLHYDQEVFRNDHRLGALYSRLYERVVVIASLLATESGEIELQDCRYALALCLRHIRDCNFLAKEASRNKLDMNPDSINSAIGSRILTFIERAGKKGILSSTLKQKVAKVFKTPMQKRTLENNFARTLDIQLKTGLVKQSQSRYYSFEINLSS